MKPNASALSNLQLAIVRHPLVLSDQMPVAKAIAQMTQAQELSLDAVSSDNASLNATPTSRPAPARWRCLIVVDDEGKIVGMLSDGDALRLSLQSQSRSESPSDQLLSDVMTTVPHALRLAALQAGTVSVAEIMAQIQPRTPYLPVVDDSDRPIGWISYESLLYALHSEDKLSSLGAPTQPLSPHGNSDQAPYQAPSTSASPLSESEQHSQAVLKVIPDLMFRVRGDGIYLERVASNPSIDFFADGSDIVGQHMLDLIPPEHHDVAQRHLHYIQKAINTGEIQVYEQQIQVGDRLQEEEVRIVKSGDNEVLFLIRDNTERKRTLEALQQSEQTNQAIINSIPELLLRIDLEGRRTFLGGGAAAELKLLPNTRTSPHIQDVLSPELTEIRLEQIQRAINTGELQIEEQTIEFGGELRHEEIRVAPLNDQEALVMVRDITSRKQVEQRFHQINQSLEAQIASRTQELIMVSSLQRAVLDSIDYAIISTDENRIIRTFNTSAQKMLGYSASEVIGQATPDLFHDPDEIQERAAALAGQLGYEVTPASEVFVTQARNGTSHEEEWTYIRKDGSRFPVLLSITALHDVHDRLIGFVGIAQDITQRKQAEAQMHTLSERLQLAAQSARMGIWDWHVSNDTLVWDERMYELFRAEASDPVQTKEDCLRRIHPDDACYLRRRIQQALRDEQEYNVEFRVILPDQSIRYIQSHAVVQRDEAGSARRVIGTNIDVTQRKQIEESLRAVSDRLELAVKSAQLGIWDWDIAGDRLFWDERMYELYGVEATNEIGAKKDCIQRIHPDDVLQTQQTIQQALQGECEYDVEFRVILPDGSIRYIQSYAIVQRNEAGEAQRAIGTNMDISDRKQAVLRLSTANQKLLQATRMKDEFLANMSHELRTPLNAILGMSEALQEEVYGGLNEQQLAALNTVERSGNHLLELINDILDLAKIEAGHIQLNYSDINVTQLCQASLAFVKQQASKKSIRLASHLPVELPILSADERRIRQVLLNLLTNAVKFTPDNGSITLSVTVSDQPGLMAEGDIPILEAAPEAAADSSPTMGSWIYFTISDTGIGIEPTHVESLFNPFFQVDSALNRQYTGTGLGLAMVKHIVEMHNGMISVSSVKEQGSRFTFALPSISTAEAVAPLEAHDPDAAASAITPSPSPQAEERTFTILIAEDNEVNVTTIAAYLQAKGYSIVVAKDGQEAIEIAASQPIDLVLMDIQMPRLDGIQAIRYIRHSLGLTDLPIIALTALAMQGDRHRCIEAGANDYLTKPVRLKQLASIINAVLQV